MSTSFQGNTTGHTAFAKYNARNQPLFSVNAGVSCEEALEHASVLTDCINKLTLQAGMNDDSSAAWAAHYLGDMVTTAARVCLNAWMNERGGVGNFEGDAIVSRLRQVIERFGESRFTRWESAAAKIDEHGPRTIDRLGFRKTMEHGLGDSLHTTNTYYVLPESWRSEIFRGMNINAVNKELLQRGVIEPGNDGKASSLVRLPGLGTQRCYIVKTIPGLAESEARAA
ncbi:hypothetical protein ALP08_03377 [Pseudomonas syringae pv. pisi]|nr:hypothetical protein ALP08_03377 [Pseudomonas syringae pv. pisi]